MPTFPANDAESYKALARAWAATVTVVTTRRAEPPAGAASEPALDGFTCTAFLMVSMTPPIIAVSATNASSALTMLREASAMAVNLLAPEQSALGSAFARPAAERIKLWQELAWHPDAEGAPLLDGALGAFSAKPRQFVEAGDHTLVLADVTAIHREGDLLDSLVYHNRGYGRVVRQG